MKFQKVTARFDAPDISIAEELICDIFFQFNLKGVVCDIPLEEPDEGFGSQTLEPPEYNSIIGFLPLHDATDFQVEKIKHKTAELSKLGIKTQISTKVVDEQDWADAWKEYFHVTPITERIIIKPHWKTYTPQKKDLVIHLDPGMAFGTGTHPTTAMCIKLMDQYMTPSTSFLDIGTGSGILMITASLLQAVKMVGIDIDPVAVNIARQNLEINQVNSDKFALECTTINKIVREKFDFIGVNIIAQVIVEILSDVKERMHKKTVAFLSGIIKERMPEINTAIQNNQLEIIQFMTEDEWVALAVMKRSS